MATNRQTRAVVSIGTANENEGLFFLTTVLDT
jgi:hypothetical protein